MISLTLHYLTYFVGRLSESGVKKIIRQLKAEGLIRRIGGDKADTGNVFESQ